MREAQQAHAGHTAKARHLLLRRMHSHQLRAQLTPRSSRTVSSGAKASSSCASGRDSRLACD